MQKIRVYTTVVCPYCIQAKRLLTSAGLDFEEISVEDNPDLRAKLSADNGGYRTVPMIFIGDEFIGGFSELATLHRQGQLLAKAQRA